MSRFGTTIKFQTITTRSHFERQTVPTLSAGHRSLSTSGRISRPADLILYDLQLSISMIRQCAGRCVGVVIKCS